MKENTWYPNNKSSEQKCGIRKMRPCCPCWNIFPCDVFRISTSVILSLAHCVIIKMLIYLFFFLWRWSFIKCYENWERRVSDVKVVHVWIILFMTGFPCERGTICLFPKLLPFWLLLCLLLPLLFPVSCHCSTLYFLTCHILWQTNIANS